MTGLSFKSLRAANATRHVRYYKGGGPRWKHDDWMVALAGEAGEALNLVKKLNRDRGGMAGNAAARPELLDQLGEELADVVIYLDIWLSTRSERPLGSYMALDGFAALRGSAYLGEDEPEITLSRFGVRVLKAVAGLDDQRLRGEKDARCAADYALARIDDVAREAGIDLGAAVVRKFNATSEKLGFPERLAA